MCENCNKESKESAGLTIEERTNVAAVEIVRHCEDTDLTVSDVIYRARAIAVERLQVQMIALEEVIKDARTASQRLDSEIAALNRK